MVGCQAELARIRVIHWRYLGYLLQLMATDMADIGTPSEGKAHLRKVYLFEFFYFREIRVIRGLVLPNLFPAIGAEFRSGLQDGAALCAVLLVLHLGTAVWTELCICCQRGFTLRACRVDRLAPVCF